MIYSNTLKKSFATKDEMFDELIAEKANIFNMKKASIKESAGISILFNKSGEANKIDGVREQLKIGDTISVAMNTTNYLDSHDDVHINGIWNKSVSEQSGKTYHVINHDLSLGSVIGYPNDVIIELKDMYWSDLNMSYDGGTQVLVFNTKMTDKTNKDAFLAYRDNAPVEHSIRMQYVSLHLCVNDPQRKEEYANWMAYYPMVANSEKAIEQGYFFAITEAKIYKEGSTVLFGSNDATPLLNVKDDTQTNEPINITQTNEPTNEIKAEDLQDILSIFKTFKTN